MSLESALKFLERVEREETLRTQLYISGPKDLEKLVQFAHGKGFVTNVDEMKAALAQYQERFPTGTVEPLKQLLAGDQG